MIWSKLVFLSEEAKTIEFVRFDFKMFYRICFVPENNA